MIYLAGGVIDTAFVDLTPDTQPPVIQRTGGIVLAALVPFWRADHTATVMMYSIMTGVATACDN